MSVWILADVLLLALIAFLGYRSMKTGFLKSSYAGIASFAALILVFGFHTPFQGYVENSVIGDTVRDKIRLSVENSLLTNTDISTSDTGAEAAKEAVSGLKLPGFMSEWVTNAIETQKQSFDNVRDNLIDSITQMIYPYVMQLLSIILLYIVIRISMWIVFVVLKIIFEIPILGTADKLLGAAIGGVNALLIIYVVSALLMLLTPVSSMGALEQGINSTFIYKYFYYNNLITTIFMG